MTPFYGFLKDKGKIIGFIYEFMCNGNLEDFVSSYINNNAYSLMAISRIAEGLEYLKSKSLVHRDLKPQNILIDNNFLPYISDFDTVKKVKNMNEMSEMSEDYGASLYIPPEQFILNLTSCSSDIYSFGLIIYYLFEKEHMRSSNKDNSLSNASEKLQNLYKKCVQFSSDNRPNIEEIRKKINEEIKHFCSTKANFNDGIKIGDALLFYEIFSNQKNYEDLIKCIENIFYIHYSLLSTGKNTNPKYLKDIGVLYFYGKIVKNDYLKAKNFFELAFKQNRSYCSYMLGKMFFQGLGVEKDYIIAKEYFEISASFNDSDALDKLGLMYQYGFGVEQDYLKAKYYFNLAAKQNNSIAFIHLGILYENVAKNYDIARECYIRSTQQGLVNGFFNLGKLYESGLGVKQDYKRAKELYEIAAKCNNKESLYKLGNFYQYGIGVEKNIKIAIKYYLECTKLNDPLSYIQLGLIYFYGFEVGSKDINRAIYYYEQALKLNCSFGAYFLADIYENGIGVTKDLKKSFQLYSIASQKNNSSAFVKLGDFYKNGSIVKQDYSKCFQCYISAAKLNNALAFVRIANLYKYGIGVVQDIGKMFSFYLRAAEQNYPGALFYLGDFFSSGEFYEPEIDKSIDYYTKCSKIDNYEILFVENDECNMSEFYGVLHNSYVFPSLNNIGLIYITLLNCVEKAKECIKNAGKNEYSFGQNNLGLLNQFYLNDINNAKYYFEKASKYNFALADYNLGHFYEESGNIKDAIICYTRASEKEDVPLIFQYTKIKDKQLEISIIFIICLTNLILSKFYFKQGDFKKSKFYFTKSFAKLTVKSSNCNYQFHFLFKNDKVNNLFSYLKKYIFNCPLFHFSLFNEITPNDELTKAKKEKIDDKKSDDFHDALDNKDEIIFEDPAHLFDFIIMNKKYHPFFIDEIKSIIEAMKNKLYEKPYAILFGRINIREIKKKQNSNTKTKTINQSFYEGFDI